MFNNSYSSSIKHKNSIINNNTNFYESFQNYLISGQNFESFQSYDK